jgi:hypothetical protein
VTERNIMPNLQDKKHTIKLNLMTLIEEEKRKSGSGNIYGDELLNLQARNFIRKAYKINF